jgi:hypothetical protein
MAEPLRHRQTKEAATDMFYLTPPRHISTLPRLCKNSDVELARRKFVSIALNKKRSDLPVTVGRRKERKQFCAFSARARFHTAWVKNGIVPACAACPFYTLRADIVRPLRRVRFVPEGDMGTRMRLDQVSRARGSAKAPVGSGHGQARRRQSSPGSKDRLRERSHGHNLHSLLRTAKTCSETSTPISYSRSASGWARQSKPTRAEIPGTDSVASHCSHPEV